MSKECVQCGFVTLDDELASCQQCGSARLRFSLLAGLQIKDQSSRNERAQKGRSKLPSWGDRFQQVFQYLVWTQASGFVLLGLVFFLLPETVAAKNRPLAEVRDSLVGEYPAFCILVVASVPVIAAGASMIFALRGVYLAQQLGAWLGPTAVLISLIFARLLGLSAPLEIWIASPLAAAALAFIAGLRVGIFIEPDDPDAVAVVEYKPADTWDRSARARYVEVPVPAGRRLGRLFWGMALGLAFTYASPVLLQRLVQRGPGVTANLGTAAVVLQGIGVFLAGVVAGSGTKAGVAQGLLAGAGLFAVRFGFHFSRFNQDLMVQLAGHIIIGVCGGMLGRTAMGPTRILRGKKKSASDRLVYIGDEASAAT